MVPALLLTVPATLFDDRECWRSRCMAIEMKSPLTLRWPSGIRMPVVLTFEHQAGEGAPLRPGERPNANNFGQMEYGARVGIWNVLELLDQFNVKATFFVTGVAAEKYPDAVRAAVKAGHELAGMSYSFERMRTASREREQTMVRRTVKALADTCGVTIKGWRCPDYRISPQTFDVLSAEGFTWDSSMLNDDLPYRFDCEGGRQLMEVPFTTSTADKAYVAFPYPVRGGPSGLGHVWKNEFNMLYREALEAPRFMILSLQTWATGRPTPLRTLEQFLERVTAYNDIQFARCGDVVDWCGGASNANH
jgi:peptidoglycan/xylan/chitin deacetylase (PgdA/CDA1 family)